MANPSRASYKTRCAKYAAAVRDLNDRLVATPVADRQQFAGEYTALMRESAKLDEIRDYLFGRRDEHETLKQWRERGAGEPMTLLDQVPA